MLLSAPRAGHAGSRFVNLGKKLIYLPKRLLHDLACCPRCLFLLHQGHTSSNPQSLSLFAPVPTSLQTSFSHIRVAFSSTLPRSKQLQNTFTLNMAKASARPSTCQKSTYLSTLLLVASLPLIAAQGDYTCQTTADCAAWASPTAENGPYPVSANMECVAGALFCFSLHTTQLIWF